MVIRMILPPLLQDASWLDPVRTVVEQSNSFGNIRRDADSGRTEVQEVREPMVDASEEQDHVLVLAELPGIGKDDVQVDVKDDVLTIAAERGEKKYRKEVLLPYCISKERIQITCNNGVLEIKCSRQP
jgi:HSP20 family protein